ncbi:hypothetical protein BV25DRAFT_1658667 [Artomyces pyxidatus]|uniref:Uncharacterized protein n=1 Tax=Artomyces pyxidatus TaxID=48021 RepID=A0ACB8SIG1_9AGAM|nr:hypothetical protein BV25DRAFT_1658667 [Artomyces pyxidatus]
MRMEVKLAPTGSSAHPPRCGWRERWQGEETLAITKKGYGTSVAYLSGRSRNRSAVASRGAMAESNCDSELKLEKRGSGWVCVVGSEAIQVGVETRWRWGRVLCVRWTAAITGLETRARGQGGSRLVGVEAYGTRKLKNWGPILSGIDFWEHL